MTERARFFKIELEVIITDADIKRIMDGNNEKLKADLYRLLHQGTSSRKLGDDARFAEQRVNVLDGAEPLSSPNKHRGGGRRVNHGKGLAAFFRKSRLARQKRGR